MVRFFFKRRFSIVKFLVLLSTVFLLAAFNNVDCVKSLLLGYDTKNSVNDFYIKLSEDANFKILTPKEKFEADSSFEAIYLGKSETYPNADSLFFSFYNTQSDYKTPGKPERAIGVQIVERIKKGYSTRKEIQRLKTIFCSEILFTKVHFYRDGKKLNQIVYTGTSCNNDKLLVDLYRDYKFVYIDIIE